MAELFTERTPRVVAARRLTHRSGREAQRAFLAEGPQAVREALAGAADLARSGTASPALGSTQLAAAIGPGDAGRVVREVFGTDDALDRHPDLRMLAERAGVSVSRVTARAAAALSETSTPQGVVALCSFLDVPLGIALSPAARLVAVLAAVRDPGNAGTVLRSADAAGAAAVVFSATSVDPYNSKTVRASAGSLFHLPVVRSVPTEDAVAAARGAGMQVLAADSRGAADLDELADQGRLAGPTAWLFGNEAHGLPEELALLADLRVRVPMSGRAESLNLAAAATVCLFSSARAHRRSPRQLPHQ